jgi:hypothetical protein
MDLRSRLLAAVDDGMSCRAAAARFGVAPSTAIRWQARRRQTGNVSPKPQGGDNGAGFAGFADGSVATKADRAGSDTLRPRLTVYQHGLGLIPETAQS